MAISAVAHLSTSTSSTATTTRTVTWTTDSGVFASGDYVLLPYLSDVNFFGPGGWGYSGSNAMVLDDWSPTPQLLFHRITSGEAGAATFTATITSSSTGTILLPSINDQKWVWRPSIGPALNNGTQMRSYGTAYTVTGTTGVVTQFFHNAELAPFQGIPDFDVALLSLIEAPAFVVVALSGTGMGSVTPNWSNENGDVDAGPAVSSLVLGGGATVYCAYKSKTAVDVGQRIVWTWTGGATRKVCTDGGALTLYTEATASGGASDAWG